MLRPLTLGVFVTALSLGLAAPGAFWPGASNGSAEAQGLSVGASVGASAGAGAGAGRGAGTGAGADARVAVGADAVVGLGTGTVRRAATAAAATQLGLQGTARAGAVLSTTPAAARALTAVTGEAEVVVEKEEEGRRPPELDDEARG